MRRLLILAASAAVLAAPASASASSVSVKSTIMGAGKLSTTLSGTPLTCAQAAGSGITNASVLACPTWSFTDPTDSISLIGVQVTASPATGWRFDGWTACASVSGNVCSTFSSPGKSVNAAPVAHFVDDTGPTVTGLAVKARAGVQGVVDATWSGEANATYRCALKGEAMQPCTSPLKLDLSEDHYELQVGGTDENGNRGPVASVAFDVIDTALDAGPAFVRTPSTPFAARSKLAGAAF